MTLTSEGDLTVSVVVPTYNRRDRLARLLRTLDTMSSADQRFEVVVVVDGATDGTEELLRTLRLGFRLVVISQPNRGPAAARNRAIDAASGEVLLFLDDDVIPTSGLIERHLELHRQDRRLVVIGRMVEAPELRMAPWLRWEAAALHKQYEAMASGAWAPSPRQFYTANASVRREHVLAVGGFDERLRRTEDVELAWRLADHGLSFRFADTAIVVHEPDRTLRDWMHMMYQYGRHDVLMARACGRPQMVELAYREWGYRNRLSRLALRACVGRSWPRCAVVTAMALALRYDGPGAASRLQRVACSVIANIQYWQGIADESGLGTRVWQGGDALATGPAQSLVVTRSSARP